MLRRVYIKNYALVEEGEIEFQPGLNIITGETGAGKSILLGAIGTLLGERTSATMLRAGEAKAIIEGHFSIRGLPWVKRYLRERELDSPDEELIIRREILASGRSRAFINDTPVTLDEVETVANLLVDLHGQHEHQSLLRVAEHLHFLDAYGQLQELREQVQRQHHEVESLRQEWQSLKKQEESFHEKADYLKFQIEEINKVDPQPGEEEELLAEEKRLAHSHDLLENCARLANILYEQEGSATDLLGQAIQILNHLQQLDGYFEPLNRDLETALIAIEEVVKSCQSYASKIEINPERLEEVRARLAEFTRLKKKYATDMDGVLQRRGELQKELARIEFLDEEIAGLEEKLHQAIDRYREAAVALSERRRAAAVKLEQEIPTILHEIGMGGSQFKVQFAVEDDPQSWLELGGRRVRAFATGIDRVEFFISANPGQPLRPLQKVASGGEISRIMLALKKAIAHSVQIPVLIFDEIDIGISGRVAEAVGRKLRELAETHQVICITHLPQIASAGQTHFLVEKIQTNDQTQTIVRRLAEEEREWAIARLLGGETITEAHLSSARELLQAQKKASASVSSS
ncbi:MAG: DNA repair protein RecN [candidate division KSB1 bacterium]|nr:DNA repair protein RecN [candidate division KSB1 bacterium]